MKNLYAYKDIEAAVLDAIRTGQTESILHLFDVDLSKKCRTATKDYVNNLKSWRYSNGCAIYKHKYRLPGVSSWAFDVTATVGAVTFRFRVLQFDMNEKRRVYLVPMTKDWGGLNLPDITLTPEESKLVLRLADELTPPARLERLDLKCNHLAKATLKDSVAVWNGTFEQDSLFALLMKNPELADVVFAAVDTQLRALKRMPYAPWIIHNLIRAKEEGANATAQGILRACAFANEISPLGSGPIDLMVKDAESLRQIQRSPGRFIFFRFREREQLQPILKAAEERERIAKSGGGIAALDYPVAVAVSGVFLGKPYALDCQIPDALPTLTGRELDLLRTAVGLVLDKQTAEDIYRCWQARITDPANYAANGALLWRYVLAIVVSGKWFIDRRQRNVFCERYLTHLCKGATAQADREKVLRDAIKCLADVDSYHDQIIEKPASKEAAEKHLADDAAAFQYTPKKGALKERELLVYTKDSILRLLEPIGLTSDLYSTFCGRCEEDGLLIKCDHAITLQGGSFHGVAFDYTKLTAYQR